jgi:hypothetical protein
MFRLISDEARWEGASYLITMRRPHLSLQAASYKIN